MPVLLGAVLLALYLWVSAKELGGTEQRRLTRESITTGTIEHLQLTAVSTVIVLAIAIPLGVLLTRPVLGRITQPAVAVFNIGQALPTIGLVVLLAVVWDIGFWPVIVALVAYTVLPVLRNTMVGLQQVDPAVIESARGMGMTRLGVLLQIELPLAVPIIMAGVRTALVINVGTATLAAFVDGGGLGTLIVSGTTSGRETITIVGAVLTAVLALLVDYVAGVAEDLIRPKGL
ncbi:MAG: ABC transporter permease subunit [Propionibacteriales bacterium]|nr:ABC transporter permease subunit [Propionibacteriales bacterium]